MKAGPPACVVVGVKLVIFGPAGAAIVIVELLDDAPAVVTVMRKVPGDVRKAAGIAAVNWVALTNVVAIGVPFHTIVELATNPEPFTVRVKAGPPTVNVDGDKPVMVGVTVVMVNTELFDAVPFAFTVTSAVPCEAMRLAATVAVN